MWILLVKYKIQEIPEIRSAIVYQRAVAKRIVAKDEISENMKSFGGLPQLGIIM